MATLNWARFELAESASVTVTYDDGTLRLLQIIAENPGTGELAVTVTRVSNGTTVTFTLPAGQSLTRDLPNGPNFRLVEFTDPETGEILLRAADHLLSVKYG